jgi:hypothetical protein
LVLCCKNTTLFAKNLQKRAKNLQKTVDKRLKIQHNTNTMKRTTITVKLPRVKRRAVELYDADSPFKPKVERNRVAYKRHPKNQKEVDKDTDF